MPSDQLVLDAVNANLSARYRSLDLLERYVDGSQYDHRPRFFDDSVPLFDRAPAIVVPCVEEAIGSHSALVLGEDHFPKLTTHASEDDSDEDEEDGGLGLSREDSAAIDRLISKVLKQAQGITVARQLLEAALGCGTAVTIGSVQRGKLTLETTRAKWCTPTWDADGNIVRLEIRYPYVEESKSPTGAIVEQALLYRRVIDTERDVIFKPARASRSGAEPDAWIPETSVEHKLGFCPVVWYRCLAPVTTVGQFDGCALHALILEELDALNFAVSQRHRATMTTLDPILAEIGVNEDDAPAPLVEQARSALFSPSQLAEAKPNSGYLVGGRSGPVRQGRKRAPGMAWQYPDPSTQVKLLTLPGDAMVAGDQNADRLAAIVMEALRWCPIDPKTLQIASTLSGRAIEWLHAKQIGFCNKLRADCGPHLILPLVSLLLRIALVIGQRGGLYLAGLAKALPVLGRFMRRQRTADDGERDVWYPPEIDLVWPAYFAPTASDIKAEGDDTRADLEAGIITRRTAVEKRAPVYGIADVEQYMQTLEEEGEEGPPSSGRPPVPSPELSTEPAPESTPAGAREPVPPLATET